ncbi:Fpg/Nei family DNA glycosylase [Rubinisphaera sp. JC750]|uniref:Fpg/Nei family DNA glycosylase n=1 Tax=Rubinisphaera sp. JC750 TaxID=2898658 RepID=UPI001F1F40BA|nr:DNA glycosylase [Rubinisphaera sp. JC750]
MPEGHVIHRIAREQRQHFLNHPLAVSSPQGRFSKEARLLNGKQLTAIDAYGKHLLYRWQGGATLHVHLGLYGKFRTHEVPLPEPRGAVRLRIVGETHGFDLNGPNRCVLISPEDEEKLLSRLGADPLRKEADPTASFERIQRSRAAIGTLLLDQSLFAGVGNIFRSEVLYVLGIHPDRPGNSIETEQLEQMWELFQEWFEISAKHNRIVTTRKPGSRGSVSKLPREERLHIYKHENCSQCGHEVRSWSVGARTAYACESCQT